MIKINIFKNKEKFKNKCLIIITIIIVLLLTGLVTSYIDSARVRNRVEPKFTIKIVSENGNKITYWGLGYKVIRYTSVSPNEPYKNSRGIKYGNWFMKYNLDRYEEIRNDINKEMERYLYFIAPNCNSDNAGGYQTHKDLVYNNGFDKEKLLDIDKKSYCKAYIKYKCVDKGKWDWSTYISCSDYEDKGYVEWDVGFDSKK